MMERLVKGALAGAAATWAMTKVSTFLLEREDEEAVRAEREARGGRSTYVRAAGRVEDLTGRDLDEEDRRKLADGLHWGLGIGAGIAYALLRPVLPGQGAGRGLSFGTAFFTLIDETVMPWLDLTPGPAAFPWQTHARGFGSHLAYGLTAEAVLQALGDDGRRTRRLSEPDLVIRA